jgi:DNA invertase Pin-like site-specific DNA recombinase
VLLTESVDTTTAAGRMFFGMLAVLAAFERDLTAERTAAALAHKRAEGRRVTGMAAASVKLDGLNRSASGPREPEPASVRSA